MDYSRLEKNITDNIIEAQIKLGYEKRPISLNYTLASLNHLLGAELSEEEMQNALSEFKPDFGEISLRHIKDGFCIIVSENGTEYVHENAGNTEFITEFINTVRNHGVTVEQVFDVFRKYGEITAERSAGGEFDYLVYFTDGKPDDYFYCIADEGLHITYHRFTKEDYTDFNF